MSSASATVDQSLDELVGRLADEFLDRLRNGEKPNVEEYAGAHPRAAELIRRVFPSLEVMGGALPTTSPATHSDATGEIGDYRLIREVGRGGMGVVYEAQQISLDRRVALKVLPFAAVLDERQIKRFRNEARAAAQLKHPNIVQVYGVGCERSTHFYAMEFVVGETLAKLIDDLRGLAQDKAAPLPEGSMVSHVVSDAPTATAASSEASGDAGSTPSVSTEASTRTTAYFRNVARIGVQVAEALDHAHQEGVIHRDIKPSNLMIDAAGKAWVTDFGLARIETDAGMTMTGDLLGTLRYMSPEQVLAKRVVVDHRTDIYSLGVTLYELLTLQPAYPQENQQDLIRHIAFEEPTPMRKLNRHVPSDLRTIVAGATEKNPEDRYATAQDLAHDLRRFLDHKPIRRQDPTWLQIGSKWTRRNLRPVIATVAAALLAAVSGLVGLNHQRNAISELARDRERVISELTATQVEKESLIEELKETNESLRKEKEKVETFLVDFAAFADWGKNLDGLQSTVRAAIYAGEHEAARELSDNYLRHSVASRTDPIAKSIEAAIPEYDSGEFRVASEPTAKGARFDGLSSFGIAPRMQIDRTPPWTFEALVVVDEAFDPMHRRGFMDILSWNEGGGVALCTASEQPDGLNDRWAFWVAQFGGWYSQATAKRRVETGVPQHVAGVMTANEARLYIDGKHQGRSDIRIHKLKLSGLPLIVGGDPSEYCRVGEHFHGVIQSIRISRAERYTGPFDPPAVFESDEATECCLDFRYDDGDYAYDRSGNGNHAILVNVDRVPMKE